MKIEVFIIIAFSRLRKSEFRNLINKIVEFVSQHDPDGLNLRFAYDKLVEAQAELSLLKVPEGANPKTAELAEIRVKRNRLIRTLVAQIKILNTANLVYSVPQLDLVAPFVNRYLKPIVKSNSESKTDVLSEMFQMLEGDTALNLAIDNLSLRTYFDELKVCQTGYTRSLAQRSEGRSVKIATDTLKIRKTAESALLILLKETELMQMKYPQIDYAPLINKINEALTLASTQLKTRSARKKQVEGSVNVDTKTTTTVQNGNSETVVG